MPSSKAIDKKTKPSMQAKGQLIPMEWVGQRLYHYKFIDHEVYKLSGSKAHYNSMDMPYNAIFATNACPHS